MLYLLGVIAHLFRPNTLFGVAIRLPSRWMHFLYQRGLTSFASALAHSERPWLKNRLIRFFFALFPQASLDEAIERDPFAYKSFYQLFARHLRPDARPIAQADWVSPAMG